MEKVLKLYTIIDGKKNPFLTSDSQIEIYDFKYNAKRMGGVPSITATIMHPTCLDDKWGESVFVEFNKERYYLKQTPTSSKSNTDARYKHDAEFVSERIALDNVFFFDAVVGNPESYDKPVSNSSTFTFFGTITELASRLNASLEYCGLGGENGYKVFVDNGVDDGETKLVTIQNATISEAIQEGYNQFEIPHYFVGKEIHYGFFQDAVNNEDTSFKYGLKNELLSITKTNSNQKIITRITGTGSTENIPYYYPNEHPQGVLAPHFYNSADKENADAVNIYDENIFAKNVLYTDVLIYSKSEDYNIEGLRVDIYQRKEYREYIDTVNPRLFTDRNYQFWFGSVTEDISDEDKTTYKTSALGVYKDYPSEGESIDIDSKNDEISFRISYNEKYFNLGTKMLLEISGIPRKMLKEEKIYAYIRSGKRAFEYTNIRYIEYDSLSGVLKGEVWSTKDDSAHMDASHDKALYFVIKLKEDSEGSTIKPVVKVQLKEPETTYGWQKNKKGSLWNIERYGLSFGDYNLPSDDNLLGYTIKFEQVAYVQPMQTLMPPVYWQSGGAERFYNAVNNAYEIPNSDNQYYTFANEYRINKRIEHICQFDDIKPTIENVVNDDNEPINEIIDIAFDKDDNDLIDQEKNEYYHPYFYVKLRRFDGDYGFNLFTHANEKGDVTFSMKSGKCGACNFILGVDSESGQNTVQVDDNGKLVYGDDGKVKLGIAQDRQNDTTKNEVWIALRKDTQTFGHVMPSVQHNYYPEVGDKFVLLNISLPKAYVEAAEKKLEQEIIKYMHENNEEKFSISIKFSRIYFAENPDVLHRLNENSLIHVTYNNAPYSLYVDSFSYNMRSNEALPEVTVELTEALKLNTNAIQNAVTQVKAEVLDRVSKMDIAALVANKYISKENEDYAKQKITFNRGLAVGSNENVTASINEGGNADLESATLKKYLSTPQFTDGFNGSGFRLWLDENNLSHLTIDVLTARQRMNIYEMIISKIRSVNGEIWVSAANGKIKEVADFDDYYEVVIDGTNLFQKGDFARCQVFSAGAQRFYWVELGEIDGNRIKIAKTEFVNSLPSVDDELVLCGSRNINRQNAIFISATEDGQPRIDIMNGINLDNKVGQNFNGCIRTRLGKLDGINDSVFGENQPHGDGLYGDNVYLKGDFILRNRDTNVETVFEIQDGKIKGGIAQTQSEAIRGKSYLYNASFIDGLNGWLTSNEESVYFSGESILFNESSLLYQSVSISSEPIFENAFFVTINNGWITQSNLYFINKPEFNSEKQYPLLFSVNARCRTAGELLVKVGEQEILKLQLEPSDKFVEINKDDKTWNGTGDFHLSFTGDADFFGLTLYTEKTEVRHQTFFEMSDRLIEFGSRQLDKDGNINKESGIMVKPEGVGIYAYNGETGEYASIGVSDGNKVKLTGEKIILEGDISANGNVSIDAETGKLTARDGVFTGKVMATSGSFGGFTIGEDGGFENVEEEEENKTSFFYIKKNKLSLVSQADYAQNTDISHRKFSVDTTTDIYGEKEVLHVSRKILYDATNENAIYTPTVVIEGHNSTTRHSAALDVYGSIRVDGGVISKVLGVSLTNEQPYHTVDYNRAKTYHINCSVTEENKVGWLLFPDITTTKQMLGIKSDTGFSFTIDVFKTSTSKGFRTGFVYEGDTAKHKVIDNNNDSVDYVSISGNITYVKFLLISDNGTDLVAQVVSLHTNNAK